MLLLVNLAEVKTCSGPKKIILKKILPLIDEVIHKRQDVHEISSCYREEHDFLMQIRTFSSTFFLQEVKRVILSLLYLCHSFKI